MSWGDYGFPDPTMLSNYSPAMAIYLAHKERCELVTGAPYEEFNTYTQNRTWPNPVMFTASRDGSSSDIADNFMIYSDALMSGRYINHLIDINSGPATVLWNRTSLGEEVSSRLPNNPEFIEYEANRGVASTNRMLAQWDSAWARQYYVQLNLLKFGAVPDAYRLMGNGSSSGKSSPEEAYNAAVSNFHPNTNTFLEFETQIWKPSIYYDLWSCNITRPIIIEPTYVRAERTPEVMQGLPSYLYANPRETSVFDAHGTGIIYNAGKYSRITLPYNSPTPAMPDAFSSGIYGPFSAYFVVDGITAVDFSSLFEFYDNVDEIPTP